MADILRFDSEQSGEHALVGGKGANLGLLTRAGFPVPPGFSVTTEAYDSFVEGANLGDKIASMIAQISYGDADQLETITSEVRDLIVGTEMPPALAKTITAAYAELGEPFVAVRSSGTAEDLAEASFAGLHDTYLDIQGADALVDAVKRCWASMWTARATSYRHTKGFDQEISRIAVVVQTMVPSEVAGVMFTGNPMTAATDEFVINASWGLGEAVVSGIVTPDEFVIKAGTLRVKEKTLGTKAVRVVRDPQTGVGTVTEDVPAADQGRFTLTDNQAAELAELGRRVTAFYDGLPQDTEWGFADGTFYLLQSRPITGVEFSWDNEVDSWSPFPDDDDYTWTRAWADEIWTGAITPLMYSFRARCHQAANTYNQKLWGYEDTAETRMWKYYKGAAYYNCAIDRSNITRVMPSQLRAGLLANMPPAWRQDVLDSKYSYIAFLRLQARVHGMEGKIHGVKAWLREMDDYTFNRGPIADGLTNKEIRRLSDEELKRYTEKAIAYEGKYIQDVWTGFFVHAPIILCLLGYITAVWYDGDNPLAFTDLITGAPKRTITQGENNELWHLAKSIRESKELRELVEKYTDGEFFAQLAKSEAGRPISERYQKFLAENSHRGHADRDIYYPRRSEDPGLDYRAIKAFLSTDAQMDPEEKEAEVNRRREVVTEEVVANIRRKPLGALKAEVFKMLLDYTHTFLMARDNERHFVDRTTFTIKRCFIEVNRRITERDDIFTSERDFYFLTKEELFDVLDGRANRKLTQAKIKARMDNFDRFDRKEQIPPMYLHRNKPADLDQLDEVDDSDGVLRGVGTSRGTVTGTARIVKELKHIGVVQEGDILVTNSTDPGWTPVFLVIKGIVLETGGMLAHGSCLAREYGFPAVQVASAMSRIPDGAQISINGDTGVVTILDVEDAAKALEPAAG